MVGAGGQRVDIERQHQTIGRLLNLKRLHAVERQARFFPGPDFSVDKYFSVMLPCDRLYMCTLFFCVVQRPGISNICLYGRVVNSNV